MGGKETSVSEPSDEVSIHTSDVKTKAKPRSWDKAGGGPEVGQSASGIKAA